MSDAWERVYKYFDDDLFKTHLWFSTDNPMLGGTSPNQMILDGRGKKLIKFINQQLDEAP
jgi:hypothetical protein